MLVIDCRRLTGDGDCSPFLDFMEAL